MAFLKRVNFDSNNILIVFKQLGYSYLILFAVIFFYVMIQSIFPNSLQDISEIRDSYSSKLDFKNLYLKFLLSVIYAPLIEELVFRVGISKKLNHIYILIGATLIYILFPIYNGKFLFSFMIVIYTIIQILIYYLFNIKSYYFSLSILFSAIYFGVIHIFNFDHSAMDNILSYFIMIIPLIVFGYTFGIIRVKLGFKYAVFGHVILNLIGFISSDLLT